jgi:hypothetical protein
MKKTYLAIESQRYQKGEIWYEIGEVDTEQEGADIVTRWNQQAGWGKYRLVRVTTTREVVR